LMYSSLRSPARPLLFPYTSLFRSDVDVRRGLFAAGDVEITTARRAAADEDRVPTLRQQRLEAVDAFAATRRCWRRVGTRSSSARSEEHTAELEARGQLVGRLLLEK